MGSILDLPLSKQVDAITTGAIRPEELLVTARQRAERVNDKLHAIVAMDETGACRQLDRAPRGRLFGVPIGIKDSIALPWRAPQDGMRAPAPTSTARAGTAVQQLQRAGALPAFATAMHQLGMGTTGHVSASGPVLNPADTTKLAGGSSGGSAAAVAAGAVPAALGTDAGGSIRIPSAYCGVVGLKPTWNAVPTDGCTSYYSSVAVIGPLARTVDDCRAVAEVLLGRTLSTQLSSPLRVGLIEPLWTNLDPDVERVCRRAVDKVRAAGAHTSQCALANIDHVAAAIMVVTGTERIPQITHRWAREVFASLDPTVRGIIKSRIALGSGAVQRVDRFRTLLRRQVAALFAEVDLLVCPTVPTTAPPAHRPRLHLPSGPASVDPTNLRYVGLANLTGIPAISLPVGTSSDGLPIGLSLHARWGGEDLLLSAAQLVESQLSSV